MIAIDTNVVRGLIDRDPAVVGWIATLTERPTVPVMVAAEIRYRIERLPSGRRRDGLAQRVDVALSRLAPPLPFDDAAGSSYGVLVAQRERAGRPISAQDAIIGATCLAHRVALATRNTKDFEGIGLDLVDPWQS
jgi:predicted nucleic acid-binding protein